MSKLLGRPPKYKKIYAKRLIKYFDIEPITTKTEKFYYKNGDCKEKEVEVGASLPTLFNFSKEIGVDPSTLVRWEKKYKDFHNAYIWAKGAQENIWMICSLKGLYNPYFATLVGKNIFNWKDKQEIDAKHSGNLVVKRVSYKNG